MPVAITAILAITVVPHSMAMDWEDLDAEAAASYIFSRSRWPAPTSEENCVDLHDRIGGHMWAWSHGIDQGYSPEYRGKRKYTPVYLLDEGDEQSDWKLKSVATINRTYWISFFQGPDACSTLWVGPAHTPHSYFATTIRGRFLDFGDVSLKRPADFDGQLLADAIAGRYRGDTVYVGAMNVCSPIDAELILRFNNAIGVLGCTAHEIDANRVVELYLKCVYPCERLFIITDPSQLDALYWFLWSNYDDRQMVREHEFWRNILTPGLKDGAMLSNLPSTLKSLRHTLPSVVLERLDGRWMEDIGRYDEGDQTQIISNVFETDWRMLFQLEFTVSKRTGLLENVRLLRILNFHDHFARYPWED